MCIVCIVYVVYICWSTVNMYLQCVCIVYYILTLHTVYSLYTTQYTLYNYMNHTSIFILIWLSYTPCYQVRILTKRETLAGLQEHIDISQIPAYYGGQVWHIVYNIHSIWLYCIFNYLIKDLYILWYLYYTTLLCTGPVWSPWRGVGQCGCWGRLMQVWHV